MKTRGSLRAMIELMPQMFKLTGATRLAIYQVRGGKYYNLVNADDLFEVIESGQICPDDSFLSITHQELQSIFKTNQINLFPKEDNGTQKNHN